MPLAGLSIKKCVNLSALTTTTQAKDVLCSYILIELFQNHHVEVHRRVKRGYRRSSYKGFVRAVTKKSPFPFRLQQGDFYSPKSSQN